MFVDSHCHIDLPAFEHDREAVLSRCVALGVDKILVPGVFPGQWVTLKSLCLTHDALYFAVGLHPWWIKNTTSVYALQEHLLPYLKERKCIAVGECGLDASLETSIALQESVFEWHLQHAKSAGLPVIIHCVKAHNETVRLLNKFAGLKGVVHGFSGSFEMAMSYWDRGFYLGIGGTITYPRAKKTRDAVARMPLESMLLETDAPDMPPHGRQGQRNSPENLPKIAEVLADIKGLGVVQVAQQTTNNFHALFGL